VKILAAVSAARANYWERAATEVIATVGSLDGAAIMLAQAVLALVRDQREWERYAERLTRSPQS
jgi:hypothetical protein